jgi:hypothetical protein
MTHSYFLAAAAIWSAYFARRITILERDRALKTLYAQHFPNEVR